MLVHTIIEGARNVKPFQKEIAGYIELMAEEPILYHSLPELYRVMGIELEGDPGFTVHRIEQIHTRALVSPVFRVNYYSFLFIAEGKGRYLVDGTWYDVGPGTVYFTNPGHVKAFANDEPYNGFLVSFSESFLKKNGQPRFLEAFPFLLAEVVPPFHPKPEDLSRWFSYLDLLFDEARNTGPSRDATLASLWVSLLHQVKDGLGLVTDLGPSRIVQRFRTALDETYRSLEHRTTLPNVEDYAAALGLHPGYLQTVIKARTGKTPLTWITEKTLAEAEALLKATELSIKEIAHRLKFPDQTHFSRYCRRHWGEGPRARRLRN